MTDNNLITVTQSVPVVVATPHHLTVKSLYQGARAAGMLLLGVNVWLQQNGAMVSMATHKWVWIGPVVSAIAGIAEAMQTYSQKQKTEQVNNTVTTTSVDKE